MHNRHVAFVFALALLSACAAPIVRTAQPDPYNAGTPVIERLVDLGGMPLPSSGVLSQDDSDGVLTPGEWVAVLGKGLDAGSRSRVTVDGVVTEIKGHLQGGSLLVQVPRRLPPRKMHQLVVATPSGAATTQFPVRSFVVVGDTSGKTVRFVPMEPGAKTVLSKPAAELEVQEAYFHALSPSGAWLYIVQALGQKDDQKRLGSEIAVVHMGARKLPRRVGSFSIQSAALPTSVAMLDESTLLVLSESELVVCEVKAGRGAAVARIDLPRTPPKTLYTDVEVISGRAAVLLDVYGNAVTLVDLTDLRQPRVVTTLEVGKVKGVPWSIDLDRDPDDAAAVWLLQGPNLRISGDKVSQYADHLTAQTQATLGMKKPGLPAQAAKQKELDESYSRLVRIRAEAGALQIAGERPLPRDFYPFFVAAQPQGEFLISGVTSDVFRFAGLPRSLDGLKSAIDVLTASLQFGRIVRLRADGTAEPLVKGPALYFNLGTLTDGMVLYSVIRPGFSVLPPSLEVEWGVESAGKSDTDQDYRELAELDWTAVIPPYAFGALSVQ
jgi:hypothetical protein